MSEKLVDMSDTDKARVRVIALDIAVGLKPDKSWESLADILARAETIRIWLETGVK